MGICNATGRIARITVSVLFVVVSANGAPVTQQQAAVVDQQAKDDADVVRFHQWCAGFVAASNMVLKARLVPEGLALAKGRREALKRIILEDPARALTLAEAASVRRSLPAEVAGLLEERISGVGEIRVRRDGAATAEVSADGLAREAHVNGRAFAAHVYGWRLVDQDFDGVPLQGVAVDGVLAVAESPLRVLDAEEVAPQQRQAGKIAADIGGQLRFFASQEDVARAELELMYGRGMPVPGPEQQAALARVKKVRRVRPNALAWQRINERRNQKHLPPLSQEEMKVVPFGQELELEDGVAPADAGPPPMTAGSTDNSALQYLPPIRSQGALNSCACFSTTYYQMTYMTALARGWDAKNGGDTLRFSPKWTYNMLNGGSDSGSLEGDSLNVQRDHGCATWADFPYDSDCHAWCLNSNVWRAAIGRRMNAFYTIGSLYTSNGLANLKAALDNGYVVTFDTYSPWSYQGWVQGTVANDPATTNDDTFVGQQICKYVRALDWGHALTVVGYNDDIWCDLNGNGVVDPGEKGALKIANSWGNWANDGYAWFACDALKTDSDVPGWNPSDKVYGFGYGDSAGNVIVYVTTAQASYTPKMLAGFTINHAQRNQITMKVGKDSGTPTSNPAVQWNGVGLNRSGGACAFDGTTAACDGTFWLDMSDLSPDVGQSKRYFVGMNDSATAGSGQLKSYTLVDTSTGNETTVTPVANPNAFYPATGVADNTTAWGFVDHTYTTWVVSNTNDSGPSSLRQAILNANVGGGGSILLSNVTGTITLTSGELLITNNISVLGPGPATLAISGNGASRVFNINSNATATISGLTVRGGWGFHDGRGGGIYSAGILTLNACTISGNLNGVGGGIYNAGTLALIGCTINSNSTHNGTSGLWNGGNGAGIYNAGTMMVNNCTISGNSCGQGNGGNSFDPAGNGGSGGGVYNAGVLTLSGCTISDNPCGNGGRGDDAMDMGIISDGQPGGSGGSGAGINNAGTLTLSDCTISGNSSGSGGNGGNGGYFDVPVPPYRVATNGGNGGNGGRGGGIFSAGSLTILNCTLSSNSTGAGGGGGGAGGSGASSGKPGSTGSGGGIWRGSSGSAQLLNSIVANNTAVGSGPDVSGSFTSQGHNLIGNTSGSSGFGASGDLLNVDPQLGPLTDNGGPTLTCALLPDSPAIDAGTSSGAPQYDQSGVLRPQGAGFDIGAFEFIFPCPGDADCDGITDSWTTQYFGHRAGRVSDKSRAGDDADSTGQNNLFKYTAGLDPTNPASVFKLRIENVAGQPNQKNLTFLPWASGRTYTTEYRTNLQFGSYVTLTSYGGPQTNSTEISITDLNATEPGKFYRIRISYP